MSESLKHILITDLPPGFTAGLVEAGWRVYKEAHEKVRNYTTLNEPEKRWLLPFIRRALFESALYNLAQEHGLDVTTEKVSSGGAEYTRVRSRRLVLTCSQTAHQQVPPRSAQFRDQYSSINEHISQVRLFPEPSEPQDASLYCIIIHGASHNYADEIRFLRFGFPSAGATEWADPPIDVIDIRDYQKAEFQKQQDLRENIQKTDPVLKPHILPDQEKEPKNK